MTNFTDYLDTIPNAMKRGKVQSTLTRPMTLNGRNCRQRREHAEILAMQPWLKIDPTKGRVYTSENGTFYTFADLTKTLVDYLTWLVTKPLRT